jgi:hypothetical protein
MRINHSDGYPNWSQLKNFDEPYSTCNVTSAINAAKFAGLNNPISAIRANVKTNLAGNLTLAIKTDATSQ